MKWADKVRDAEGARQRRHAARRAHRARTSAPRASASAAPSTCSSTRSASPPMREMILADDVDARERALAKLLPVPARGLRRHLPRDGGPAGHHPPPRSAAPRVPAARTTKQLERARARRWASASQTLEQQHQGPPRVQPDARPPRLPPRDHLPRDLRDAGARDPRGGRATSPTTGIDVHPEIMIPLAMTQARARASCAAIVDSVAQRGLRRERGTQVAFTFGTMIELPRAALVAGELAADGRVLLASARTISRRRRSASRATTPASSCRAYVEAGIFAEGSVRVDRRRTASARSSRWPRERGAQGARRSIKLGICGEHGGDPASIHFFQRRRASTTCRCSPFRVPIARLAAAQAALKARGQNGGHGTA